VHRGDLGSIDAVERRGTRRAGVVGYTAAERFIRPSLRGLRYRSVQTFRRTRTLDTCGDACRKRCKSAGAVAKGRHGPDARPGPNCALATVSAPIPTTPATTFWLVLHTSANSTIATARQGSSPPTMQDLDATNVIWGTSRPLPDETQAYVATLAPIINHARTNVQLGAVRRSFAWASSSLFAARSAGISPDGSSRADMRQNRTSRAHGTVDLSGLVPHSRNLLVHLIGEMRSR
jgi:hypothetical protein